MGLGGFGAVYSGSIILKQRARVASAVSAGLAGQLAEDDDEESMIEVPVAVKTLDQDDGIGHAAGLSGAQQFEAEVCWVICHFPARI